jgi:hypothetical protein
MTQPTTQSAQKALFSYEEFIRCYQILDIGCRAGLGLTMAGLETGLNSGQYQLHTSPKSAMICEVLNLPEGRTCYFTVTAGDLTECIQLGRDIEKSYIEKGITKFLIIGRTGWDKVLPDYKKAAIVYKKGFD